MRLVILATLLSLIGFSDASAERRMVHQPKHTATGLKQSAAYLRLAKVPLEIPERLAMREVDRKPSIDLVLKPESKVAGLNSKIIWKEMLIRMRDSIYEPFPSTTIVMGNARAKMKRVKVRSFFLAVPSASGTCPGFGAIGKF